MAKSYILQLAAERLMNPVIVKNDGLFNLYLESVNVTSKAMRFGAEQEANAIALFEKLAGVVVYGVSLCQHDNIDYFAASPDGVIYKEDRPVACVEVKCPKQEAWMRYSSQITDAQTLKDVMPQYYWQTLAEMECTNTQLCYFLVYSPWQRQPLCVAEIRKNEADAALLRERVSLANAFIQNIIEHKAQSALRTVYDTVSQSLITY